MKALSCKAFRRNRNFLFKCARWSISASTFLLLCSATMNVKVVAQTVTPGITVPETRLIALNTPGLTLEQAGVAIEAAIAKAIALGTKMDIAVVGAGGHLKAFVRMDDACLGCIDIAIRKARTARFFDRPTGALGALSQPGGPLYGIEHSNDGLITFPGGVLIKNAQGQIIGAIGVSGDTVENDHLVATAGANAILK